jgi:hypothetical protein
MFDADTARPAGKMRMLNFRKIGFCMDARGQAQRDRPDHRRLCMRAEMTLDQPTVPGSAMRITLSSS